MRTRGNFLEPTSSSISGIRHLHHPSLSCFLLASEPTGERGTGSPGLCSMPFPSPTLQRCSALPSTHPPLLDDSHHALSVSMAPFSPVHSGSLSILARSWDSRSQWACFPFLIPTFSRIRESQFLPSGQDSSHPSSLPLQFPSDALKFVGSPSPVRMAILSKMADTAEGGEERTVARAGGQSA